jgi:hypothetical protein
LSIGRVLENLAGGKVEGLAKQFKFLSPAIKRTIEELAKTGETAAAQEVFLDSLAGAVGGAGAAENQGLTGAVEGLGKSWNEFLEALADPNGAGGIAADLLRRLAAGVNDLRLATQGRSLQQQLKELEDTRTAPLFEFGNPDSNIHFRLGRSVESQAELDSRVAVLQEQIRFERELEAAHKQRALAEALAARTQADADRLAVIAESEAEAAAKAAASAAKQRAAEAARAAEVESKRIREARSAVEARIAGLQEEQYQLTLTDEERFVRNQLLEAEAEIKKGLTRDGAAYLVQVEAEARALFEQNEALAVRKKAEEEVTRAAEAASKERQVIAEREAKLMLAPFENAIEGIQGAFTDAFSNIFSGGLDSFSDLGGAIKSIFVRLAAEIASLLVFRPVVGGVMGAVGLGGLATQMGLGGGGIGGIAGPGDLLSLGKAFGGGDLFGGLGASLFGGQPLTGAGGYLTGGGVTSSGAGFVSSGLLGTGSSWLAGNALPIIGSVLPGLMSGNFAQAGLGGLGALAGSFVLPGIGTALGGLLGNLVGGLFGSTKHPASLTNLGLDNGLFALGLTQTKDGGKSEWTIPGATAAVDTLNQILESLGGTIAALPAGLNAIKFGGADPNAVAYVGGVKYRFAGNEKGLQEALDKFIFEELKRAAAGGKLAGVSATALTVIENSKAVDSKALLADLEFAKLYDALTGTVEQVSAAEQALKDLEAQFAAAGRRATELGLGLEALDAGLSNAKEKLREGFEQSIADAILGLTDPQALALKQLEAAQKQRLEDAHTFGADLVEVERLNALERQKVIEQFAVAATASIRQLIDRITLGPLSALSPEQQLFQARGRYVEVARGAQGGEAKALAEFATVAESYLGAARGMFASGEAYARVFEEVLGLARQLGQIPGFAAGGVAQGWAWVGENGPELARFDRPARILDSGTSRRLAGSFGASDDSGSRDLVTAIHAAARGQTEILAAHLAAMNDRLARIERELGLDRLGRSLRRA